MPPLVCPRCRNTNPEAASFCYYDGEALRGGAPPSRAAREPAARGQGPRLELTPRRINLGSVLAGETRQVDMTVSNHGQGTLQGTLTVAEGGEWLRVGGAGNGQCQLNTAREQKVSLQVDTRGLPAAQTYGARLTIVTNGGVVEVPVRLDLAAHPFPKAPFQGARTPRELAEKMRTQPKHAVPMLESGEIGRWLASNGWNYPTRGTPARGVAGVQQFFEAMGLAKPPVVQLSQAEYRASCTSPDPVRAQVVLQTGSKKWVYANVESDSPWLRVLTPQVAGPQQAPIAFEIDPRLVPRGRVAEGHLKVSANGGQNLTLRVRAHVIAAQVSLLGRLLRPALTGAIACLLLRLVLAPVADGIARGQAAKAAAARLAPAALLVENSPFTGFAGWLELPWPKIFLSSNPQVFDQFLGGQAAGPGNLTREFRDLFASGFIRIVALWTFWVGAVGGAWVLMRRGGGMLDLPWGLVAGAVAGLAGSATLACLILAGDLVPQALWALFGLGGGAGLFPVWILFAVACWALLGAGAGAALGLTGPLGGVVLAPVQSALAGLCRAVGMKRAAGYFTPAP